MSSGSKLAVEDAEEQHLENTALRIANDAAKLVAARDMDRAQAIHEVTEAMRQSNEADDDVTGVLATMISVPKPSKASPPEQVAAIAEELLDAARDAADTL
ncbi:hypothetical protein LPN04_29780 [Rugamonas sp. A1-17]|nr:hypothetical protein [Rugamonas sp. A1-17]